MTKPDNKQLVDAGALADILRTTTDNVNKLHRDGVLPAYRTGRKQRRFDVEECLARLRVEVAPTAIDARSVMERAS